MTSFRPASSASDSPLTTKIASEPIFHAETQFDCHSQRFAAGDHLQNGILQFKSHGKEFFSESVTLLTQRCCQVADVRKGLVSLLVPEAYEGQSKLLLRHSVSRTRLDVNRTVDIRARTRRILLYLTAPRLRGLLTLNLQSARPDRWCSSTQSCLIKRL